MPMAAPVLLPPLRDGDHLTRDEFMRRWEAMPEPEQISIARVRDIKVEARRLRRKEKTQPCPPSRIQSVRSGGSNGEQ